MPTPSIPHLLSTLWSLLIALAIAIAPASAALPDAPTIKPNGGTFTSAVTVKITTTTSGGVIRYTLDGTSPTAASIVYDKPFQLAGTATVKAKTFVGAASGGESTALFRITGVSNVVATPVINPPGGTYANIFKATITCATSGATIRYTVDGSQPTASSPVYTAAVPVTSTGITLRARAFRMGYFDSGVALAAYQLRVATPTLSPAGGTFSDTVTVSASGATIGTTYGYTTDGSIPTASSPTLPATFTATTTLTVAGFRSGFLSSAAVSATYVIESMPRVSFDVSDWTAYESDGGSHVTVVLDHPSDRDVSVDLVFRAGSATLEDVSFDPSPLVIPAGSGAASRRYAVSRDWLHEDDEEFSLTLSNPVNATIALPSRQRVVVVNLDPTVQFRSADVFAFEDDSVATFFVLVQSPENAQVTPNSDVSVTLALTGGTASDGSDYTVISPMGVVTIPAGSSGVASFDVWIRSDTESDSGETIEFTLTDPVNAVLGLDRMQMIILETDKT
jgi:hypothetical protein